MSKRTADKPDSTAVESTTGPLIPSYLNPASWLKKLFARHQARVASLRVYDAARVDASKTERDTDRLAGRAD